MSLKLTPQGLEISTQAWLGEWRRGWLRRYPGKESPVQPWESYSASEQHLMMKAVKAALVAAQPENIQAVIARRDA